MKCILWLWRDDETPLLPVVSFAKHDGSNKILFQVDFKHVVPKRLSPIQPCFCGYNLSETEVTFCKFPGPNPNQVTVARRVPSDMAELFDIVSFALIPQESHQIK